MSGESSKDRVLIEFCLLPVALLCFRYIFPFSFHSCADAESTGERGDWELYLMSQRLATMLYAVTNATGYVSCVIGTMHERGGRRCSREAGAVRGADHGIH